MAGAAPITSGKGGKKSLDAPINLVPFIDLLSCCICFLLITAVWINLAAMETNQRAPSKKALNEEPVGNVTQLVLFINPDGYLFKVRKNGQDSEQWLIPLTSSGDLNRNKLQVVLEKIRDNYQSQHDLILMVEDSVSWNKVIQAMETAAFFKKEDGTNHFAVQISDQTVFAKAASESDTTKTEPSVDAAGGKK